MPQETGSEMFGNLAALSWYISHFKPLISTLFLAPIFHLQLDIEGTLVQSVCKVVHYCASHG